jgi:putative nucleotidyltransferase-like protein
MSPAKPAKTFSDDEAELLVHCARLELDAVRADRIKFLASSDLNWERLMSLAQRNAIWPFLFFHLNRIAPDKVPQKFLAELRNRFQSNGALNVILTAEMIRLLDLFERNKIPAIPYKGPAIGVGVYRNLSLRQFADLDILVPEDQVWKATELLKSEGYAAHFVIPETKKSNFLRLSYVRLFKRETDETTVELHWRLAPRFFGVDFDTSKLWQTARTIPMQRSNVRFPLTEDFVLMLCIHGAKDIWEKLEWVCGLAELIRTDPDIDWKTLIESAKQARCFKILSLGLTLARDLLEAPVPEHVSGLLAELRSCSRTVLLTK